MKFCSYVCIHGVPAPRPPSFPQAGRVLPLSPSTVLNLMALTKVYLAEKSPSSCRPPPAWSSAWSPSCASSPPPPGFSSSPRLPQRPACTTTNWDIQRWTKNIVKQPKVIKKAGTNRKLCLCKMWAQSYLLRSQSRFILLHSFSSTARPSDVIWVQWSQHVRDKECPGFN